MLWSDEVVAENSREMKRLWLAGTIAAGFATNNQRSPTYMAQLSVELADLILEELNKGNKWEKPK